MLLLPRLPVGLILLPLVAACSKPATTTAPASSADIRITSDVSAGKGTDAMHARLDRLTYARDAYASGRTEAARASLADIAEGASPGMTPEDLRVPMQDLLEAASSGAASTTDQEVASAIAQSARACGECHELAGKKIGFAQVEMPPADAVMARHMWAADRMWESLIGPDAGAWFQAHSALGPAEKGPVPLPDGASLDLRAKAAGIRTRLYGLVEAGAGDATLEERAGLYGNVLGTCAECHTEVVGGG